MERFRLVGDHMNQLLADLQMIQEKMESSYSKVKKLEERIETQGEWEGKERDTFLVYLKLMKEYHKCFTDSCGKKRDNPLQEAEDALKELEARVDNFYADFPEYQKIEKL